MNSQITVDAEFKRNCAEFYAKKRNESGLNNAEFMRVNGIDKAYGYRINSLNYDENYPKAEMWLKIAGQIGYIQTEKYWKHIDFRAYQSMYRKISEAHKTRTISLISGDTGAGKSYTCIRYMKNPSIKDTQSFYYRVLDSELKPLDFMKGLQTIIGIDKKEEAEPKQSKGKKEDTRFKFKLASGKLKDKSLAILTDEVIEYFQNNPQNCLIIDECEYLNNKCWDRVRKIIYELYGVACVVVVGAGIESKLKKMSLRKNALENGHRQFYSRIERKIAILKDMGYRHSEGKDDIEAKSQNKEWIETCKKALEAFSITDNTILDLLVNPQGAKNIRDLEAIISEALKMSEFNENQQDGKKKTLYQIFETASSHKKI